MNKPLPMLMKPVLAFAAIDVSKTKGYDMINRGEIPVVRIGTLLRIPRSWVEARVAEALTADALPQGAENE